MWGPWQVGQMTAEDYSKRAAQWAKALKLLDPTLVLILCGETGHSSWDFTVLKACIPFIDMHSIHIYTSSPNHLQNVTAPLSAEHAIRTAASLISIARIEANIPPSVAPTRICFDEWNVWDPLRAPGEKGAEEIYTLSDALAVAVWLNVFIRQSQHVAMANIAQTVNVISPLLTTPTGVVKQTTWYPLYLFSKYMHGRTLGVHVRCGAYEGLTEPKWLQGCLEEGAPWLDVSACIDKDGVVNLAVVNISETEAMIVDMEYGLAVREDGEKKTMFKMHQVTGPDIHAANLQGKEMVSIKSWSAMSIGKTFCFPKHSFTLLRWKMGEDLID